MHSFKTGSKLIVSLATAEIKTRAQFKLSTSGGTFWANSTVHNQEQCKTSLFCWLQTGVQKPAAAPGGAASQAADRVEVKILLPLLLFLFILTHIRLLVQASEQTYQYTCYFG